MADFDGDLLAIEPFSGGTVNSLVGASQDGDVLNGLIPQFSWATHSSRIGSSHNGDVLSFPCGGSMTPTGVAAFTLTRFSDTPYRLVYSLQAVVTGGGADATLTVANATLVANCFQGECPLRTKLLDKVYASALLATQALTSGDGETNIYGLSGTSATWSLDVDIDGGGKPVVKPSVYTLNDGTYKAIIELIFRHSIVV